MIFKIENHSVDGFHYKNNPICVCSYCSDSRWYKKMRWGINLPEDFTGNSWVVIKYWHQRYIRFTIPFFKKSK